MDDSPHDKKANLQKIKNMNHNNERNFLNLAETNICLI